MTEELAALIDLVKQLRANKLTKHLVGIGIPDWNGAEGLDLERADRVIAKATETSELRGIGLKTLDAGLKIQIEQGEQAESLARSALSACEEYFEELGPVQGNSEESHKQRRVRSLIRSAVAKLKL